MIPEKVQALLSFIEFLDNNKKNILQGTFLFVKN